MTKAQKRDTPPVGHPIVRTHPDPGDNVCSSVTTLNTSSACLMTKVERGSKN